jgi:hypothetical protein
MAAHVGTTTAQPALGQPIRIRRPRPRFVLAFALLLVATLIALAPQQVADAAHAACTVGNPDHVTCGEALVLLGYP